MGKNEHLEWGCGIWNFLIRFVTKLASWTCAAFWHRPSFTAESEGCSVVCTVDRLFVLLSFHGAKKLFLPLPTPTPLYVHLLASNVFSALFLFDLYSDVGLLSHLAANDESSGLWTQKSGDEENYLWSWWEWVREDKLWVISAGDDPENGVWAQLVAKTEIPLA